MKKLILSAVLFLGITATGFSQQKPERAQRNQNRAQHVQKSPEERAQHITDALDKKLSLTADQKAQIYQINLERAQAMNNFKGDRKNVDRSQIKSQFEASDNKILNVLNESQKATYNQLKADRQAKMKDRQGGRKRDFKNKKA